MVVVTMNNCPPKLRGDLSKWLLEINTGVYVGRVSARVREALWKRVCENIRDGQATMVFTANNEQHMDFYVHNTDWKPVDFDGIKLMRHPSSITQESIKTGFSDAAKRRMGRRRRHSGDTAAEFCVIDIETTGLSYLNDSIIEIGVIKCSSSGVIKESDFLIRQQNSIPESITALTGITDELLNNNGIEPKTALKELYELINEQKVLVYNAGFDISFLEEAFRRCELEFPEIKIDDVYKTAKTLLPGLENYKLETVAAELEIGDIQFHRALSDCKLLYKVFTKLNDI